jgi:hypothetical protein
MHSVGLWLQKLGSQRLLLRNVTIFTDFCRQVLHQRHSRVWYSIPLFSIVKAFWMPKQTLSLRLRIETPTNPQSLRYHDAQRSWATELENVIHALVIDLDLSLRRVGNFIEEIYMKSSPKFNRIYWKGSRCQTYMEQQNFVTFFARSNSGLVLYHKDYSQRLRQLGASHWRTTFRWAFDAPEAVQEYLWRSIMMSKNTVEFDLDTGTHTGSGFDALRAFRCLRYAYDSPGRCAWYNQYWQENRFQVQLLADELHTQSSCFEHLRLWLCLERSEKYPWACRRWKWHDALSIILRAKIKHRNDRANIQIYGGIERRRQ